jgi:tripartite-type tricarboxylate transporter receptor subunit TctC
VDTLALKTKEAAMVRSLLRAVLKSSCAACLVGLSVSGAAADEPFYKGKRLTMLINYAPGGPSDIEGRLLARHLAKHIEGQPPIIVQNKDGAGGLVGTNYVGELGPKDGSIVGFFTGAAWKAVVDPEGQRVDFKTFDFVGLRAFRLTTRDESRRRYPQGAGAGCGRPRNRIRQGSDH